jgi:hypothetical protein
MSKFVLLDLPDDVIFDLMSRTSKIWIKVTSAVPSLGPEWCADIVQWVYDKIRINFLDVLIIMEHTAVSRKRAIAALAWAENDLVEAVLHCHHDWWRPAGGGGAMVE